MKRIVFKSTALVGVSYRKPNLVTWTNIRTTSIAGLDRNNTPFFRFLCIQKRQPIQLFPPTVNLIRHRLGSRILSTKVLDNVEQTSTGPLTPLQDNVGLSSITTDTSVSQIQSTKIPESLESIEASSPSSSSLVYESPLGNVVSKLRTVSLCTAIIGMTGVPAMIAIKGALLPEVGILAAALLFVSGSVGSTAAIHFVFSPYVYKIEQIPIRVCSTTISKEVDGDTIISSVAATDVPQANDVDSASTINNTTSEKLSSKDTLLKAWTRSLFLRHETIIFDPTIDVQPYKGLRPMCNFVAKGRPLYVHPGK
jgi:hypothetical protein